MAWVTKTPIKKELDGTTVEEVEVKNEAEQLLREAIKGIESEIEAENRDNAVQQSQDEIAVFVEQMLIEMAEPIEDKAEKLDKSFFSSWF
jgi:ATP-dependent Lon protease